MYRGALLFLISVAAFAAGSVQGVTLAFTKGNSLFLWNGKTVRFVAKGVRDYKAAEQLVAYRVASRLYFLYTTGGGHEPVLLRDDVDAYEVGASRVTYLSRGALYEYVSSYTSYTTAIAAGVTSLAPPR